MITQQRGGACWILKGNLVTLKCGFEFVVFVLEKLPSQVEAMLYFCGLFGNVGPLR